MEIAKDIAKKKLFTEEDIPEKIMNVKISAADREALMQGMQTGLIEGLETESGPRNGKLKLRKDKKGEVYCDCVFQRKKFEMPEEIYGNKLSDKQKTDLTNGKTVVVQNREGQDRFLKIDKELNTVTVSAGREVGIPSEIGNYKLTASDKEQLANGGQMKPRVFYGEDSHFTAMLSISADGKGFTFTDVEMVEAKDADKLKEKLNTPDIKQGAELASAAAAVDSHFEQEAVNEETKTNEISNITAAAENTNQKEIKQEEAPAVEAETAPEAEKEIKQEEAPAVEAETKTWKDYVNNNYFEYSFFDEDQTINAYALDKVLDNNEPKLLAIEQKEAPVFIKEAATKALDNSLTIEEYVKNLNKEGISLVLFEKGGELSGLQFMCHDAKGEVYKIPCTSIDKTFSFENMPKVFREDGTKPGYGISEEMKKAIDSKDFGEIKKLAEAVPEKAGLMKDYISHHKNLKTPDKMAMLSDLGVKEPAKNLKQAKEAQNNGLKTGTVRSELAQDNLKKQPKQQKDENKGRKVKNAINKAEGAAKDMLTRDM